MKPAIRVDRLSKSYRLGERVRGSYRTLRDSVAEAAGRAWSAGRRVLGGRPDERKAAGKDDILWALRDVSFDVEPGEVVGVIGHNGAGKSTLLKVFSRITEPTSGRIEVRGRIASLLEVGTGFHPELTGRENIFLNGAILGMSRREIEAKFDEIVAFSGVQAFLDTPVKRYSSGMHVRLAFAVAAHLEPEILLIDEVLAVGDAAFQKKCLGKMRDVASSGRTVLFVSHNMGAVRSLCSRGILMAHGRVAVSGPTDEVVREYLAGIAGNGQPENGIVSHRETLGQGLRLVSFRAEDPEGGPPRTGGPVAFLVGYEAGGEGDIPALDVGVAVKDLFGAPLFTCTTGSTRAGIHLAPSKGVVACVLDSLPLIPGVYGVDISLAASRAQKEKVGGSSTFQVVEGGEYDLTKVPGSRWGSIILPHAWEVRPPSEA